MSEEGSFLQKNGKKMVLAITGAIGIVALTLNGDIDPMIAVIYLFTIGGVGAGSISR